MVQILFSNHARRHCRAAMVAIYLACWLIAAAGVAAEDSKPSGASAGKTDDRLHFGLPLRFLLSNAGIQADLKLSDEQLAEIKQQLESYVRRVRSVHTKGPMLGNGNNGLAENERRTQRLRQVRSIATEHQGALYGLLSMAQRHRVFAIRVRLLGFTAFREQPVVRRLGLTDVQRQAVETIHRSTSTAGAELQARLRNKSLQPDEYESAARRLLDDALARAEAILTPDQKQQYDELCGAPLPFDPKNVRWQLRVRTRPPMAK